MRSFSEYYESRSAMGIQRNDLVRNAVAGLQPYWPKPGQALSSLQEILHDHGYILGGVPSFNVHDRTPDYTQRFDIEKIEDAEKHIYTPTGSMLVFSWHWMPSGEQVEITAYVS